MPLGFSPIRLVQQAETRCSKHGLVREPSCWGNRWLPR